MVQKEKLEFENFCFMLKCLEEGKRAAWINRPPFKVGVVGNSILHIAVEKDTSPEVIQMLLSKMPDCNIGNSLGESALHLAVAKDRLSLMECMIKHPSMNLNKGNKKGETPLHYCCKGPTINISMIKLLLEKGANVNKKDRASNIPLHLAVKEGNLEAVQLLMQNGANPKENNNQKKCPLYIAQKEVNDKRITECILSSCNINKRKLQDLNGNWVYFRNVFAYVCFFIFSFIPL